MTIRAPQKIPKECYENLFEYLKKRQNGLCEIANSFGVSIQPDCLHHARMHNTATNRKLFPDVIHSLFNLLAVKNDPWHLNYRCYGVRKGYIWAQKLQLFLSKHPKCRDFVNGKTKYLFKK